MPLPKQRDEALRPINYHRKEIRDVTTKHTHVKGFCLRDRGILPSKHDFAMILTGQPNPSFDNDRADQSPYPTKPFLSDDGLEAECPQDVHAEYGTIGTGIHQERRLDP
jgi:hypothetical protein